MFLLFTYGLLAWADPSILKGDPGRHPLDWPPGKAAPFPLCCPVSATRKEGHPEATCSGKSLAGRGLNASGFLSSPIV